MKRSHRASLVLMGATPFLMFACDRTEPGLMYRTAEECKRAGLITAEDCDRQFEWASDENERVAPRYSQQHDCESDFGASGCESGGAYYRPRMSGMLVRHLATGAAGNDGVALRNPQPLYESIDDRGMLRTAGNHEVGRLTGPVDVAPSVFHSPQGSRVLSRGGFGRAALSHGGSSHGFGFHGGG